VGFLDAKSRVIDVVLTERGRKLYSVGQLDFAYFSLLDDDIDYDPWSTGSMDADTRDLLIANALILEAPVIRHTNGMYSPLEPKSHLFTASGLNPIPHVVAPSGSRSLSADQRRDSTGKYVRTGTSVAQITPSLVGESVPGESGFVVRVFSSGSNGAHELDLRRDLSGRRAYDPFIAVAVDSEQPVDRPVTNDPKTIRQQPSSAFPRKR